jgi:CHAD domain-containing protein
MAYAIERGETLQAAVQRIMDEQVVRARDTLADPALPAEKRVHEARKRFKEIRALLRLIRKPLGEQFAHENAWYRDAARELAASRDADAILEALDKLGVPQTVARRAKKKIEGGRASHPPLEPIVANVIDQLVVAHGRLGMWPELGSSFDEIGPGLLRAYREGRRDMKDHSNAEELHEWRKRVKEHWYHAQLLRHLWPEMMKPYADELSALSKALGDHHDLHVLGAAVPELLPRIEKRQAELETEAMRIGRRVYAEKPPAWLARMRNLWDAWTSEP